MPLLTILTPCFNEEDNVREVHRQVKAVDGDAARRTTTSTSSSTTPRRTGPSRSCASSPRADRHVKVIVNTRNFGHIRSPYHALPAGARRRRDALRRRPPGPAGAHPAVRREVGGGLQGRHRRQDGQRRVVADVPRSRRSTTGSIARLSRTSSWSTTSPASGSTTARSSSSSASTEEPYPYFRGLVSDFGYERAEIPYVQPARKRGVTKNNFYTLYDMAMLGDHQPLEGAAAAGDDGRLRPVDRSRCWSRSSTSIAQAGLVGHLQPRPRPARDRRLLPRRRAALLHRHPRRVHRLHPHPGPTSGRWWSKERINFEEPERDCLSSSSSAGPPGT